MITLTPAYGRDYTSQAKVRRDLAAGKDFIYNAPTPGDRWDGKPCNVSSLRDANVPAVQVRYHRLRRTMVVQLGDLTR